MISFMRILFLVMLCSSFLNGKAQNCELIKMEDIPQRKIRNYIISKSINKLDDFSLIKPSWGNNMSESDYHLHSKKFIINKNVAFVWNSYSHIDLKRLLTGNNVRFGLLLKKYTNTAVYAKDLLSPEIDTGQIYFLDLRLLKGLLNIPVAFEIINIDPRNFIVEFSYIDSNIVRGKQTLKFSDNGDGRTRILHLTYFKSNSKIRDGMFYPHFHRKFIKEFHKDMQKVIEYPQHSVLLDH